MSYQYNLKHMPHLMAMYSYSPLMNYTAWSHLPLPPTQNQQIVSAATLNEREDDEDVRSLFCANLDQNVTEELIYELFLQAGPVERVYIPIDKSGKRRSYAFVTYKNRSTPSYALKLYQGVTLFGKRLDIKFQGNS